MTSINTETWTISLITLHNIKCYSIVCSAGILMLNNLQRTYLFNFNDQYNFKRNNQKNEHANCKKKLSNWNFKYLFCVSIFGPVQGIEMLMLGVISISNLMMFESGNITRGPFMFLLFKLVCLTILGHIFFQSRQNHVYWSRHCLQHIFAYSGKYTVKMIPTLLWFFPLL